MDEEKAKAEKMAAAKKKVIPASCLVPFVDVSY